jgi:hypothetical protein
MSSPRVIARRRISGSKNFRSRPQKDFCSNIGPKADIGLSGSDVELGATVHPEHQTIGPRSVFGASHQAHAASLSLPSSSFVQRCNRSERLSACPGLSPVQGSDLEWGSDVNELLHPSAPHDLPGFITAPGDTDVLMVVVGIVLILAVLAVGNLYLRLHALPEQMAHKSQKLQFEIVAVLGLLALFTHIHLFWVIGLLLAMIDLPDWSTPLRSIAGSVKHIAGIPQGDEAAEMAVEDGAHGVAAEGPDTIKAGTAKSEVQGHA